MKLIPILILLFPTVTMAQIEVSDKTIGRILSEDSKEKAKNYYRGEISEAQAIADAARKSNSESLKKISKYEQKIRNLEQANEALRSSPKAQTESPAQMGARLGNIPGNSKKGKPRRRRSYYRSKLSFAVSKEESEPTTILPAGSWVRAKILTGVQANSKYPYNVLMQLDYAYTGPNKTSLFHSNCGSIFDVFIRLMAIG